ncbi:MAG: radical SAM protein [Hyphomonadaceae bacterium]|nr:radical SAM protein [Hyphomonadaceae bacterium]MBC6411575.1 radical SAM protein [Hyphomonadaceae bacterium]
MVDTLARLKFSDPHITAKGEQRAHVEFDRLKILWFNTGSLCNIACTNCYINSSPTADHFVYLTRDEVRRYLDEIENLQTGSIEIGLTGGEPFMNPHIIGICEEVLNRGHSLLILTNAMQPMMRQRIKTGLVDINTDFPGQITCRVSLDHYSAEMHDAERGSGSFDIALRGIAWLHENAFHTHIAGRTAFAESEADARTGFAQLITAQGWDIDPTDPVALMLFPEMDDSLDVPEITTACWDILGVDPKTLMCASSRMIVKRKGAKNPAVMSCTLLWEDTQFEMGEGLAKALTPVSLNHHYCTKFCVLGGASCSA